VYAYRVGVYAEWEPIITIEKNILKYKIIIFYLIIIWKLF